MISPIEIQLAIIFAILKEIVGYCLVENDLKI